MMKTLVAALCLAFAVSPLAMAAQGSTSKSEKQLTPQQQRMAECSHRSKGMKGDEHKKFMSDCLKGHTTTAHKKSTQQEKMKSCNAEAKSKKLSGTARKQFMSGCLKG
jgi:hypothetical protein